VLGNMVHALGVLGGQIASRWHGRAALHGQARAELARGIGPVGRRGSGGEVTARAVVGAALPRLGAHGGHGDALGEHGVDERHLCEVGRARGLAGTAITHWGLALVAVIEQKGEREGF
jgi:hypothetical protein